MFLVTVDRSGTVLLVVNYRAGSVAGFSLKLDGQLGERVAFIEHR